MPKLLIADPSAGFVEDLRAQLKDLFEITICTDGRDVISLLHDSTPDLLLLDLMLPGCDGLSVLESINAMKHRPVILVASRFYSFYVQDSLERLGISYAMQKPCDAISVSNRIRELAQYPREQLLPAVEEKEIVSGMLHALGINSKHIGWRYLTDAICIIAERPRQQYTKELYPAIAERAGSNWRQVERDIRRAIEQAWDNRNRVVWQEFFPNQPIEEKKPNNSTFISTLGQLLSVRLFECQNPGK